MENEKTYQTQDPFEIDEHELEDVLDEFLTDDDQVKGKTPWNFANIVGVGFLLVALLYAIQIWFPIGPDVSNVMNSLPFLGTILVLLTGLGLISATKTRNKKKKKSAKSQQQQQTREEKKKSSNYDFKKEDIRIDPYGYKTSSNKLMKSRKDKKLFGVCGGLARFFNIDSTFVRFAFVFGAFLSYSAVFWIYIALGIFLEKEPKQTD